MKRRTSVVIVVAAATVSVSLVGLLAIILVSYITAKPVDFVNRMPYTVMLVCASDPVVLSEGQSGNTIVPWPNTQGSINCSVSRFYGRNHVDACLSQKARLIVVELSR